MSIIFFFSQVVNKNERKLRTGFVAKLFASKRPWNSWIELNMTSDHFPRNLRDSPGQAVLVFVTLRSLWSLSVSREGSFQSTSSGQCEASYYNCTIIQRPASHQSPDMENTRNIVSQHSLLIQQFFSRVDELGQWWTPHFENMKFFLVSRRSSVQAENDYGPVGVQSGPAGEKDWGAQQAIGRPPEGVWGSRKGYAWPCGEDTAVCRE